MELFWKCKKTLSLGFCFNIIVCLSLCAFLYANIIAFNKYRTVPKIKYSIEVKRRFLTKLKCVLVYSLFGINSWQRYGQHIENVATQAAQSNLYKNWTVRIYHDGQSLNQTILNEIKFAHRNLVFVDVRFSYLGDMSYINAMLWRYLPIGDPSVDIFCARDLDSNILQREQDAVDEWLWTEKVMHVMRDNIRHTASIMGGMTCFRNSDRQLNIQLLDLIITKGERRILTKEALHGQDQKFLGKYIWPLVKHDTLHHDAYLCMDFEGSSPFPTKRDENFNFVGCSGQCKKGIKTICPVECRPKDHKDWLYC